MKKLSLVLLFSLQIVGRVSGMKDSAKANLTAIKEDGTEQSLARELLAKVMSDCLAKVNDDCDLLKEVDNDQKHIRAGEKVSGVALLMQMPEFSYDVLGGNINVPFERASNTAISSRTVLEWQASHAARIWMFTTATMQMKLKFAQKEEPSFSAGIIKELTGMLLENERSIMPYKGLKISNKAIDAIATYPEDLLSNAVFKQAYSDAQQLIAQANK